MALRQKSATLRISAASMPQTLNNALPSAPTPGRTVFFICSHYGSGGGLTSVTIAGATATLDRDFQFTSASWLRIYRATVPASPTRHVVLSGGGTDNYITGSCFEVDAVDASPLDQYKTLYNTYEPPSISISTDSPTVQADELVIAQWTPGYGSSNLGTSTPSGYEELWQENDSNTYQGGNGALKFVTATGVQTATWPVAVNDLQAMQLATYKATPPGGSGVSGSGGVTGDASVSGSGAATTTGAGAVAGDATVSGSGAASNVGTGAVSSDATVSGSGAASNVGSGGVTGDASVSGAEGQTNIGTGGVIGDASASGSGAATATGEGGVSGDATVSGSGVASNIGTGGAVGDASVSGSESFVDNVGSGGVTGDATVAGAGAASNVGSGGVTGDASVSGSGAADEVLTGTGNVTSDDVSASGSGAASNVGIGSVVADSGVASGAGLAENVGSGAVLSADSVANGSGGQPVDTNWAIKLKFPAQKVLLRIPSTKIRLKMPKSVN